MNTPATMSWQNSISAQCPRSEKTMKDFYRGILGIPVAGATLPVLAFFLLGIYGGNAIMLIGSFILGIGHIGIHLAHRKESCGAKDKKKRKTMDLRGLKSLTGSDLVLQVRM